MNLINPSRFPILILSILFFLILVSCGKEEIPKSSLIIKDNLLYKQNSNVPFTGKEKAKVKDKIIEYEVKDGYKHGEFKIYNLDGILEVSGQLDSNRNVGKWQYFHPNGELESEGNFDYDLPEGKWLWYYPDGKKKEEGFFSKGKRVGIWYQYDRNGKINLEKNFDLVDSLDEQQDSVKKK
jgi:antitoxin component YwqK of YwqJK toxin-antitoxin module